MPKVSNRPMGEKSPNLVTLIELKRMNHFCASREKVRSLSFIN
jgi:hypothetical protein